MSRGSAPEPSAAAIAAPLTGAAIAALVHGELIGRGDTVVRSAAPLDRATGDQVSFLASRRYAPAYAATKAGVVLVAPDLRDEPTRALTRVVVADPHAAMLRLLPLLYVTLPRPVGVHPTAIIGHGARIGEEVAIGAYAIIGTGAVIGDRAWIDAHTVIGDGVEIGADVRLFPHVTLYSGAVLGDRVVVHSGARIAADGFGYAYGDGAHQKIPHVGRCVIGDDVEIGANTTIDRGSIDDTVIGAGTKIDNLVQVAHNVRIGRLCLLMSQVGIAGSAHIEDGVILAGQVGVGGHLTIGAGARLGGQAGVIGNVPAGATWSGYPARPHRETLRASAALSKLSGMLKRIERLLGERE